MRLAPWIVLVFCVRAAALESYYGPALNVSPDDLLPKLHQILSQAHIQRSGQPDELASQCPDNARCIQQKTLGYDGARRALFGRLFLLESQGEFAVSDSYCNRVLTSRDFPRGQGPGPNKIPATSIINAEHAWPQSRFSRRHSKALQKADIHNLFSTSSLANSLRGNQPFGDVITASKRVCPESELGLTSRGNVKSFEPPQNVRGDVARALFYFATRYQLNIDSDQEETLRNWHRQDPVDEPERERHEVKFELTHIRNPYIDHPEWVDQIRDF